MKKIRDFIAGILYRILLVLVKMQPVKKGSNHLLIIKLDEIGDYMLFRNNLKYFRRSEKYKNHKITLLGNAAWKPIFDEYDSDTVNDTIWITKKKFNSDLDYRFSVLKQVRFEKVSDVINCVFSSGIVLEDGFAFVCKCSSKTSMKGDNSNKGKYAIDLQPIIYNSLCDAGDKKMFDSIRNKNFLNEILGTGNATLDSKLGISWQGKNSKYLAIFIGAGNPERRWPIENFVECSKYAWEKYGLSTIVLGGKPDEAIADQFVSMFKGEVKNLAGKTSLSEVIHIFNGARFAISTDTGPLHIAVAAACPVIGLFSGKYYKRYSPYPKEITSDFYPVYPDFIDNLIAKDEPILYDPFKTRNNTIKFIDTAKILPVIDQLMLA